MRIAVGDLGTPRAAGSEAPGRPGAAPTLVADQVYDVLANAIFSGRLPAGARLPVRDLAERVGTSVMPVREAIRQLVKDGLAVTHPHRGARVREFTHRELIQIYDLRSLLEVEATRHGAPAITVDDLEVMQAACERMHHAVVHGRVGDVLDDDETVLRQLYRAGGNAVMVDMIESLWTQCRAYKVIGARAAIQNDAPSLWEPTSALVEALQAGDTDLAVEINRESVAAARRRLEAEIASPG